MKRLARLYVVFVAALLVLGVAGLWALQRSTVSYALGKLGKSPRDFSEARTQLLLGAEDPSRQLLNFAYSRGKSVAARVEALTILEQYAGRLPVQLSRSSVDRLLADRTPAMQTSAFKMLERAGAQNGLFAVAKIFKTTSDTAIFQASFRTLRSSVGYLLSTLGNPASLDSARLDSMLAVLEQLPIGKGAAYPGLSQYFAERGDYSRAVRYSDKTADIGMWWVVGSWDNRKMAAFHKALGPETRPFDPRDTFTLEDGSRVRWMALDHSVDYPGFENLYVKKTYAAAFAAAYVRAPAERDALFLFGSDDAAVVYVNGKEVYGHKIYRGALVDDDVVRIHLKAGVNVVMVKVLQDVGGWALKARIADLNGEAMPDVAVSLSDTSRAPTPAGCAARMIADESSWNAAVLECGVNNDAFAREVVRIAVDSSPGASQNLAALRALRYVNSRRLVPAGEEELLAFASRKLAAGQADAPASEALRALEALGTRKGLEVGKKAREFPGAVFQFCGNRLVSLVCRDRLFSAGRLDDSTKRAEIGKTVRAIEELKPTDPWVLERIAAFYAAAGDNAKAKDIREKIAMPGKWLLYFFEKAEGKRDLFARTRIPSVSVAERFDNPQGSGPESQAFPIAVRTDGSGVTVPFHVFDGPAPCVQYTMAAALYTSVFSDKEDSAYLYVSIPLGCRILFNGTDFGTSPDVVIKDLKPQTNLVCQTTVYDLEGRYQWQRFNFDALRFSVRVKKGMNTVCISAAEGGYCFDRPPTYFRVGFSDMNGNPVGCKDLKLQW